MEGHPACSRAVEAAGCAGSGCDPRSPTSRGCGGGSPWHARTVPRGSGRSSRVRMWFRAGAVGEGFSSSGSRGLWLPPHPGISGAGGGVGVRAGRSQRAGLGSSNWWRQPVGLGAVAAGVCRPAGILRAWSFLQAPGRFTCLAVLFPKQGTKPE